MGATHSTSGAATETDTGPIPQKSGPNGGVGATQQEPNGAGGAQAGNSVTGGDSRSPHWRLLIGGLLIALVMSTIMVTTYVSAEHGVVARNLPWGVTGTSPLTSAVQRKVSLQIHTYADEVDLIKATRATTIYGGFVPQKNTVIISEAASLWAPAVMSGHYAVAARARGIKLHFRPVNLLPKQDPEGVVPGLVGFVLLVAGYLASTFAMQRTGTAAAHRRVISLIGYSVVAGLVIDLIVGPLLGAYKDVGTNFWPLWGEFALVILAVALLAATLQSLIGPVGTLVTVIIVVFLGNPTTGGVNGTAYLPAFWQFLGPILPPWNGVTLIRNTLYFGGNAVTQPLIVLGAYVVGGIVLVEVFSWRRLQWWRKQPEAKQRKPVITRDEEAGVAAMPPA